jgi:hypothetical protein
MLGLTVQNFVSAATGMAVLVALIRGFARRTSATIGSFWVDLVRSTVHVLLPLSVMLALALVSRGVVQTLDGPASVQLLDPIHGRRRGCSHDRAGRAARSGRVADRDQAARHERRRLLQTRTRRTRSRIRTRSRTCSSRSRSS